jgi:hypothetical protein
VVPSRPSRLLAHDRAWRNLATRPISPQNVKTKAWPETKLAFVAEAEPEPAKPEADAIPEPNRDRPNLPVAIMVMIGVTFGAVVGLIGWPVLQALGVVKEPVIETVQRSQGEIIHQLDATVQALNATITDLSARVTSTNERQEAATRFMAEIDASFLALNRNMRELREAQKESWLEPMADLTAAAAKARSDIVRLRASVDELSRLRFPEATAIGARIDRIEQAMLQHKLLGAMRGSIPAQEERPRPVAAAARAPADGHIFNLKPAE